MNIDHINRLQYWLDVAKAGKTIECKSKHDSGWYLVGSVSSLGGFVSAEYQLRIKSEPVFKEVAAFKSTSSGTVYAVFRNDVYPVTWVQVSNWVKVEIKNDVS